MGPAVDPVTRTEADASLARLVPRPLFISSRLMAAYRIENVGVLHLHAFGRRTDPDGDDGNDRDDGGARIRYKVVIEDADGLVLEDGDEVRSGVGEEIDYLAMMETLLALLESAAESAHPDRSGAEEPERDVALFAPPVAAWAYRYSDELSAARLELEPRAYPATDGSSTPPDDGGRDHGDLPDHSDLPEEDPRRIYLDLSPRVLPRQERERVLDWPELCPVRVVWHQYGAWINVPSLAGSGHGHEGPAGGEDDPLASTNDSSDDNPDDKWHDYPHLQAVLRAARDLGAWWINIDHDADGFLPELPLFTD